MNYRNEVLLDATDVGEDGTKSIDLEGDEPISRIDIKMKVTKATDGMDAPGPANITRIEIVDGSEPLYSCTGYECQAMAYYNRPGVILSHGQELAANSEEEHFTLDFGRWLWDPRFAFIPSRFKNPQLKITFDEDLSDTGVTVNEMEVLARRFDEKIVSPEGFLTIQEWFDYVIGSNTSYETIKLPEDHVIRQMLVRAYRDGYEPWAQIDEARFDEGGNKRVPWNYTDLEAYFRRMKSEWPLITYPFQGRATVSGEVYYVPTTQYWSGPQAQEQSGTVVPYFTAAATKGGKLTARSAAPIDFDALAQGWLPWHCFQFPMGLKDDPDDWYNPAGKAPRLRLRAASSGTNGRGQLILEQLRRY